MKFSESKLGAAMLIEVDRDNNEHGYFTRTIDHSELRAVGLVGEFIRSSYFYGRRRGTLRGINYQMPPFTGPQLLRCIRGAIYAVIVDLRPDSPTKLEWEGFDLSERNCRLLYIPVGFGLGFQTRIDDTEVIQQLAHPSAEEAMTGLRYNDPLLAIRWPEPVMETSPQDASWPPLRSRESRPQRLDASIALHSA